MRLQERDGGLGKDFAVVFNLDVGQVFGGVVEELQGDLVVLLEAVEDRSARIGGEEGLALVFVSQRLAEAHLGDEAREAVVGAADTVADGEDVGAVRDGAVVGVVGRGQSLAIQEDARGAVRVIREGEVMPFASREVNGPGGEEGTVVLEAQREGDGVLAARTAYQPGAVVPVRLLELAGVEIQFLVKEEIGSRACGGGNLVGVEPQVDGEGVLGGEELGVRDLDALLAVIIWAASAAFQRAAELALLDEGGLGAEMEGGGLAGGVLQLAAGLELPDGLHIGGLQGFARVFNQLCLCSDGGCSQERKSDSGKGIFHGGILLTLESAG